MRSGGKGPTIQAYERMVRVLDCFSQVDRRLSLDQIARRTSLPNSTVHRILASLKAVGFIEQNGVRESYELGTRLFALGSLVLENMDIQREAQSFVESLQRVSGETVHLAVFDGLYAVLIDRRDPPRAGGNIVTTLARAPCFCTSVGKAILAFQSTPDIEKVIAMGIRRYTRNTIADLEGLRAELKEIRRCGFSVDRGEFQIGVRCVGAPIRKSSGLVVAAISVSGPADHFPDERVPLLAEIVIEAAQSISDRLGWRSDEFSSLDYRASAESH